MAYLANFLWLVSRDVIQWDGLIFKEHSYA